MIFLIKSAARLLVRVLAPILLLALALAGLAVAVFSIQGGSEGLSLPELARILSLPRLESSAGELITAVEASGPIALLTIVGGVATILFGMILLLGVLGGRDERMFLAEESEEGTLAAKRRPVASIASALAEQARGVVEAKVSANPSKRGGSVGVKATHNRSSDAGDLHDRVDSQLEPLRSGFGLTTRVRAELGGRGKRVE